MRTSSAKGRSSITRRHRDLLLVTSVLTCLLIILGGIVCVTDSSRGCPDWPACYGQLLPPLRLDSILEYTHRVVAALTSLFIVASAIVGWHKARTIPWLSWPPMIAFLFLLAVAGFGAMAVLRGLEPGLAALDLGSALTVLALMLAATTTAFSAYENPALPVRVSFASIFARCVLWTLVAVFIVLVSGVLVAPSGSVVRCLSWPLFDGRLNLNDLRGWLEAARYLLAGAASVLVLGVVAQAWRRQGALRRVAVAVGVLFLAEIGIGALRLVTGGAVAWQLLHVATTAIFWALLIVLAMLAGLAPSATTEN